MASEWFYHDGKRILGPVTSSELRRLVRKHEIFKDTPVQKGVHGKWLRAGKVHSLFYRPDGTLRTKPRKRKQQVNASPEIVLPRNLGGEPLPASPDIALPDPTPAVAPASPAEMTSEGKYYYLEGTTIQGPVTSKELRRLAKKGGITKDSRVRKGDDGRWLRGGKIKGLFRKTIPLPGSSAQHPALVPDVSAKAAAAPVAVRRRQRSFLAAHGHWLVIALMVAGTGYVVHGLLAPHFKKIQDQVAKQEPVEKNKPAELQDASAKNQFDKEIKDLEGDKDAIPEPNDDTPHFDLPKTEAKTPTPTLDQPKPEPAPKPEPKVTPPRIRPNLNVLAIGISNYPGDGLKLDHAAEDAQAVLKAFAQYSQPVFREVHSRLIVNSQATRRNIIDGLNWLVKETVENDVTVLFYSGHGQRDANGQFYLLPVDGDAGDLSRDVSDDELKARFKKMPPSKQIAMLDSCHAGALGEDKSKGALPDEVLEALTNDTSGLVVMASSMGSESSFEASRGSHGYFTQAVLDGLSGKTEETKYKGFVFLELLDGFVKNRVRELSGGKQHTISNLKKTKLGALPLAKP